MGFRIVGTQTGDSSRVELTMKTFGNRVTFQGDANLEVQQTQSYSKVKLSIIFTDDVD